MAFTATAASQKLQTLFRRNVFRSICRIGVIFRIMWYLLIAFMVIEFLVLNCVLFYAVSFISNELSQIKSPYRDASFFEKLQNNWKVKDVFNIGKKGGFVSIMQETLERLYIVHEDNGKMPSWTNANGSRMKAISFMGLDVSHSGESSYLYRRIFSRESFPYHFLIVDIGANDGLISSNSFNFIQWGWNAVLVEPQGDHIKAAKNNLYRYIDPGRRPPQSVKFVQGVIGHKDGYVKFVQKPKTFGTESHIYLEGQSIEEGDVLVTVPCMTVNSLVKEYSVPRNFGILSIDAEGFGAEILRQWITANFRPAYIIFERIHQQEALRTTIDYLMGYKYFYIETRGWNLIFEHQP